MKITFLGTGTSQGIPVIACKCIVCSSSDSRDSRLRSSLLISHGDHSYVIDAGPDFRQQMLREKVDRLDAILLTHEHKDHTGGMDDVRAYNFISRKPMDIYCDSSVKAAIMNDYGYVFSGDNYPGVPRIELHSLEDGPFVLNGMEFIPVPALHNQLTVYGFRVGDLTYLTDVSQVPAGSMKIIRGSRFLVINALRKTKHMSHFSLPEAIDLVKELSPERAFITHIGHQMGLHADVSKELPGGIELAYDGLSLEF